MSAMGAEVGQPRERPGYEIAIIHDFPQYPLYALKESIQ